MEKELIKLDEFRKVAHLTGFGGGGTARLLMQLLQLKKINKYYSRMSGKNADDFLDTVISVLELKFEINEDELKRIPTSGAFISVSNHPFGGVDGILLLKVLTKIRPDYKLMANFLLQRFDPIQDFFIPVNPFESHKNAVSSFSGFKNAIIHVQNGQPMGIFPAGEVAALNPETMIIQDREWQYPALKFIKKAHVPVVPIYFDGSNSKLFHLLGIIHPMLRTAKLPSELFNKKNKMIRIRIGNPIPVKDQDRFNDISQYGRFLRVKTNALGTPLEIKKFFVPAFADIRAEKIVDPTPNTLIEKEIAQLQTANYLLFKNNNYTVYCTPAFSIPNIIQEIGRLREETFREVGEGTNRSIDLDEFDLYYHQLFIWDEDSRKIVGAYRVGKGREILNQYGKKGFYIHSLFRVSSKFLPYMQEALELGRSFIVKEYQHKPLPLFLLWKGILYFLLKHPEYRYLIGPVSISNHFSKMSKALIIEFIKSKYFDYKLAQYIKPRKKFHVKLPDFDTSMMMEATDSDINKLDKFIEDIEPTNFKLPVLLKKYIKLNAKIIGFNIDPKFNDALDGLMILDLFNVPMETIRALSKELDDDEILDRFYTNDPDYL
jgi:putative hemolysin